ncbi:MAG: tyrosine-type recombinase/integrase [Bacteroidia bacterium]|nr:tyrosine-type recombinase/integrase [Bacteroidia bacterium]
MKHEQTTALTLSEEQLKESFEEYLIIKRYSKSTIQGMMLTAERFRAFTKEQNIPLENISYADVMAYIQILNKQGTKQKTQNTYVAAIKRYIDHLVTLGIMPSNPTEHIKLQGTNQRNLYQVLNLEELEKLYYQYPASHQREIQQLVAKQNKIIVGLLVWQGLRTEDLCRLTITDLKLREGKIFIPGGRKTEQRTLELKSHQVIEMMDFIHETRKAIMQRNNIQTQQPALSADRLFIGVAGSSEIYSIMKSIVAQLKKQEPKLKNVKQIRASVITLWLKQYNLRKVQYMAGHRYVSSTEKFKINDLEGLQEELNKYHPIA